MTSQNNLSNQGASNLFNKSQIEQFCKFANDSEQRILKDKYNFQDSDIENASKKLNELSEFLSDSNKTAKDFDNKLKEMGIDWKKYWQQLPTTGWIGKLTVHFPFWNSETTRRQELFDVIKTQHNSLSSQASADSVITTAFTQEGQYKFKDKKAHKKSYLRSILKSFICFINLPTYAASFVSSCLCLSPVAATYHGYITYKIGSYLLKRANGIKHNRTSAELATKAYLNILTDNAKKGSGKSAISSS